MIISSLITINFCIAQQHLTNPSQQKTTLSGIITEQESGDPVIYGSVALYQNDVLVTGVETDFDGEYAFADLAAGIYKIEVSYVGFPTKRLTNVEVKEGFKMTVNVELTEGVNLSGCGGGWGYEIPLVEQDNTTSGQILTSGQIRRRRSSN